MRLKKKWIILFRVFLTVLFLISIVDFMTVAGMFIYNNFIVGKTLMVTFLGILISTAEILYIHLFIEYFRQVTQEI